MNAVSPWLSALSRIILKIIGNAGGKPWVAYKYFGYPIAELDEEDNVQPRSGEKEINKLGSRVIMDNSFRRRLPDSDLCDHHSSDHTKDHSLKTIDHILQLLIPSHPLQPPL